MNTKMTISKAVENYGLPVPEIREGLRVWTIQVGQREVEIIGDDIKGCWRVRDGVYMDEIPMMFAVKMILDSKGVK